MPSLEYYETLLSNPNVQAYLHVIRYGEDGLGADGYRKMIGGTLFNDFSLRDRCNHAG